MTPEAVPIHTPYITLDALLKLAGAAASGGEAKTLIQSGRIRVNGVAETRRGRKLYPGDTAILPGIGAWVVTAEGG